MSFRKQKLLNDNNAKDDRSKNGANRHQRISDAISLEIPGVGLARRVELRHAGDDGGGGHIGHSSDDCLYVQDHLTVHDMETHNSGDRNPHRKTQSGSHRRRLRPLKNEPLADVAADTAPPSGGGIAELGNCRGQQNLLRPLDGLGLSDNASGGNGERDADIPTVLLQRLKCMEDSSEAQRCNAILRRHRLLQNSPVSEVPVSEFQREEDMLPFNDGPCTTTDILK